MPPSLTIGVVPGVTPDRWTRVWRERFPRDPLAVVPLDAETEDALAGVDMAFLRLPLGDREHLHVIPLWEEAPVVVVGRDHPVKLFDGVTRDDLAEEQHVEGWQEEALDLVAAGHAVATMPQSVFRATGRRDLVARPITDAEPTRIALVWRRDATHPLIDEFVGVVRGRTANSSRSAPRPQGRARRS